MLPAAIAFFAVTSGHSADIRFERDELTAFINASRVKFAPLSQKDAAEFDHMMRGLSGAATLTACFETDDHPNKARFYREFVVQTVDNSLRGDVGDAMFASLVLSVTPPRVILEAIAPELGPKGRLHALLDRPSPDTFESIQGQRIEGCNAGGADFDTYVRYLRDGPGGGLAPRPNAEVLVGHMFKTDVQEAFAAMLRIEYGFEPHSPHPYPPNGQRVGELRRFQVVWLDVGDYMGRMEYSFPIREGKRQQVELHLKALVQNPRWWVRLYVAEILRQRPELREPHLVAALLDDENPLVRKAMQSARKTKREHRVGTARQSLNGAE
jgi:hypothetical protein